MMLKAEEKDEWESGMWLFLRDDTGETCSLDDAYTSKYVGEVVKADADAYLWRSSINKTKVNPTASYSKPYKMTYTKWGTTPMKAYIYRNSTRTINYKWTWTNNTSFNTNAGSLHGDMYYFMTAETDMPPNGTITLTT